MINKGRVPHYVNLCSARILHLRDFSTYPKCLTYELCCPRDIVFNRYWCIVDVALKSRIVNCPYNKRRRDTRINRTINCPLRLLIAKQLEDQAMVGCKD